MKIEPNRLEIFLTKIAFSLCGKSVYQDLRIVCLLTKRKGPDFGCGMGTVAYMLQRLPTVI